MKKELTPKNYYDEYLEVCNSLPRTSGLPNLWKFLKKVNSCKDFNLPLGTCLIDYATRKYDYLSNNSEEILSYSRDEYLAEGLKSHATHFHQADRVIFDEQVFRDIRKFWSRIPQKEIPMYRFSFNQRHLRKDGSIEQFLQQSTYLEPQHSGLPAINLLTFNDITDFKTDDTMVLSISRFIPGEGYMKVFSKSYTQSRNLMLSPRESEIVRLSLEGYSSKKIAVKLFLSIHTVKNHKRNMMEKTSTHNITELINKSITNRWI